MALLFQSAIILAKDKWIADINVKKFAIMENVNVLKKQSSNADVEKKTSKLFVEGKPYV